MILCLGDVCWKVGGVLFLNGLGKKWSKCGKNVNNYWF